MADFHYRDNKNAKTARRRMFRAISAALITVALAVVSYIIYDALSTSTVISSTPPTSSTLAHQTEQSVFENDFFRLVADDSWREAPPVEEDLLNFRFQSFERELVRRELTVYVNAIPSDLPLTHVVPVESNGTQVIPLSTSPKCDTIQPESDNKRDVALTWAGVSFICDPDLNAYIVGTSHAEDGYGLGLNDNRFFFLYRDLEAVSQMEAFHRLLRGFEAK